MNKQTQGQRDLQLAGVFFLSILLAVVGQWAFEGTVSTVLLCLAVTANVGASWLAPRVPISRETFPVTVSGGIAVVVALIVGMIMFGGWCIAYGAGALILVLFSIATND